MMCNHYTFYDLPLVECEIGCYKENRKYISNVISEAFMGEDLPSLVNRGVRLRRGTPEQVFYNFMSEGCFPLSGGFFICPESRGQTVTQGGPPGRR